MMSFSTVTMRISVQGALAIASPKMMKQSMCSLLQRLLRSMAMVLLLISTITTYSKATTTTAAAAFSIRSRVFSESYNKGHHRYIQGGEESSSSSALEKAVRVPRKGRKSKIKPNERVIFFPTAARRSEDGTSWDVPIHGWIFEPETRDPARRAFVTSLRKYLRLGRDDEESKILRRRVGPFLVDNERRKRLSIQIGNDEHARERRVFEMPKSGKNGHFECELTISDDELSEFKDEYPDGLLHFTAVTEEGDDRVFEGVAHLIPSEGLSVISDIDDTVKITHVGSKRKLLRSTFMEEFQEVKGMAEKYRQWEQELGAKFHFVSSSPWQLWEEIDVFLRRLGFPLATYHLKPIRLKDRTLFDLWKDPVKTKTDTIESILEEFPYRMFALVGDTGEKDPEVYGEMSRRYPQRVQGIFLRNVTNETGTEERYVEAFEGVDPSIVTIFNDPQEMVLSGEVLEAFEHAHSNVHES